MTKHLYIHIPFCKNICSYCDFTRIKTCDFNLINDYCNEIIKQIELTSIKNQYETIYIGGGTPNYIPNQILNKFLSRISKFLDFNNEYEFTIECNPEFLTLEQAKILKSNFINRVSIGAQILNDIILKLLNRNHNTLDITNAIQNSRGVGINNISLDFIYNLPFMTIKDIDQIFEFINKYKIPHISFYSLELKENSILTKQKHILNNEVEEKQLLYILECFKKLNYQRYEISNWCISNKYKSKHNIAYWLTKDWKGIGNGAHGFEYHCLYNVSLSNHGWNINCETLSLKEYYFQVLMMGLRLVNGINISISPYKDAYEMYKNKIKNCTIKNNYLSCNNVDILDDILIELLD